jgi:hypothetical protein
MKANELSCKDLMIGDWVIFHDSGYTSDGTTWEENRVCQIDSIDEDVRVKWYDESGYEEDWPHVSTMLLSPIPLTPEILGKNRFFPYDKESKVYRWEYNEYVYINADFETEEPFVAVHNTCYHATPYCRYVHQLQHAMLLCGIEKEIVL